MKNHKSNLVWIDLEMSGLDISKDVILEIATIITDNQLNIIDYGPNLIIHQPTAILDSMDQWCITQHGKSGLIEAVKNSSVTLEQAQTETLEFIAKYTNKSEAPLCGNSVWQDKIFLKKYMSQVDDYLNYRIIDVSSIKEIISRWYGQNEKSRFIKPENHRAKQDIVESINELSHYRKFFFLD